MTTRIFQIGNPNSPLNYGIGLASQSEEKQIYWFSHLEGNLPGVRHLGMPTWIGRRFFLRALLEPFFLAYYLWKIDPHIVQVHYASKGLATIPIILHKPLLVTTMGSDIARTIGYRFPYRFWIDLMLKRADLVTARSRFMKKCLVEMGVESNKIEVNSWGIDLEHFQRKTNIQGLRKKWGVPEGAFVFFDPRSANPLYNKDVIIKAFAAFLDESKSNSVLLIAAMFASDKQMSDLKRLVEQLGIKDQIVFIGSVVYEEMPELYSLAECTVSVPSSDGMPQTIFEAWACGSFLIVGDLPQYDEFIEDGVTAKRVAIRDVSGLAEAMSWVHEQPEVRAKAIYLGRKKAGEFADRKVQRAHYQQMVSDLIQDAQS